jgi:hypothetical protein
MKLIVSVLLSAIFIVGSNGYADPCAKFSSNDSDMFWLVYFYYYVEVFDHLNAGAQWDNAMNATVMRAVAFACRVSNVFLVQTVALRIILLVPIGHSRIHRAHVKSFVSKLFINF